MSPSGPARRRGPRAGARSPSRRSLYSMGSTMATSETATRASPDLFERPRAVRRPPALVDRRGVGDRSSCAALPFAPQVAGALRAGGFILDDLESARARQLLEDELGAAAVGHRRRAPQRHAAAGTPECRGRRGRGDPRTCRARPHVVRRRCRISSRRARCRPTGARPTTSCSSTSRPTTRPDALPGLEAARSARRPGSRVAAGRRPGVLRRRPGACRRPTSSAASSISLPLAALALLLVFGSVVAAGVPLAVGGAAVLVALAAIFVDRQRHADEHLRAQPRDAAGPRARASTTRC